MKRILITGGAGFIGSNVARTVLQHSSAEVVILDNLSSGHVENLSGLNVQFLQGDIRDEAAVAEAVTGCDTIFHLAASVGNARSIENPIDDSDVNVMGTLRVLEAARRTGVSKLVYSSSAGIFGELKTLPIAEDHPIDPDSPYGASKLAAEKLCLSYAKLYPIDCVCLRYFNVYGVNQRYDAYGNVIPIFANRLKNDVPLRIFGDGEQTRDFVNVRDVAEANYRAALAKGVSGAFNIGSGSRITINHLADLMFQASGRKTAVEHAPPRSGDVRDSLADISQAGKAFGFRPVVPMERGLTEYMDWFQSAAA